MILQGHQITKEDSQDFYFSSFEGKYIIMDNLDEKGEPVIQAKEEVYNSDYVYVTVVLRGSLHLIVGGTEIELKSNDYLAVMPCMSVAVKESTCLFFTFLTQSHLMADITERTKTIQHFQFHAFKFHHAHFTPEIINTLLECYQRIKKEHLRDNYPMKELVLRAYQAAFFVKLFAFIKPENVVSHVKNTRQYRFFNEFITRLDANYKKERSVQFYANEMLITPKYLSSIVLVFTGLTASQVIDQYVIYAIKQTLYTNERNIKTISKEFNFPSQSFFGRYFKRITGMSPNEYIKHHNIKSINFVQNYNQ